MTTVLSTAGFTELERAAIRGAAAALAKGHDPGPEWIRTGAVYDLVQARRRETWRLAADFGAVHRVRLAVSIPACPSYQPGVPPREVTIEVKEGAAALQSRPANPTFLQQEHR